MFYVGCVPRAVRSDRKEARCIIYCVFSVATRTFRGIENEIYSSNAELPARYLRTLIAITVSELIDRTLMYNGAYNIVIIARNRSGRT